jgi:hypothetical protein
MAMNIKQFIASKPAHSVTFGTGAAPGQDWPTLLAAMTGWRIVNAGVAARRNWSRRICVRY